ncbi:hypothetical protein OAJ95_02830 [Pelagibacteraceae bacterium]|nr:hypothetical protein [Pelagibacteraceae bacterium]
MKISPESFVVDEALCLNYKSFFISGNDESYIFALMSLLVRKFSKNGFVKKTLTSEDSITSDLFKLKNKYVYVCEKYLDNSLVEEIEKDNDILIFCEKSSVKNKSIKQFFSKSKERVLLECYELDQGRKKIILDGFIKNNDLFFEKNTYWFLLGLIDNRYALLEKELEKILLLENKNNPVELASALNINRLADANKFFFKLHLNSGDVASFLNSSINSLSDFYSYFSYFKIYSLLLFESKNKAELENKIPKYLFREKQGLLSLFDSLNENKKKLLSLLVFKTEKLVRKNPTLFKSLFFRFVLNYKKIIS